MNNNITLKIAQSSDAAKIAAIEKECFSEPWSENAVNEFILSNRNVILCAFSHDTLCGYVSATQVLDEVSIANVAVSEKFRRVGIASILIEALVDRCISQNATFVTLEVRKSNFPAISLYEKFGFKTEGLRKNYYKYPTEDALVMNRYFNEENL